ncbi:putative cytochrome P450 [Xylariaceae sp. FL1019]|nr:putative cytochrome P450 [Xylariaceae sp. FL1019]
MAFTVDNSTLFLFCVGLATAAYFATQNISSHDPREPPLAPQSIPLIGHLIGMSRGKFNYYVDLSKSVEAPIFTMPLPGQKMYVVTKPDLVLAVQKQHRTLAFPPVEAKFASTVCGASPEAQAILAKNVNGDGGDFGLSMESYAAFRTALKPGAELDDMNRAMIREISDSLDELLPNTSRRINLYDWLRTVITTATTRSVYGPMNPYEDPSIIDAFWQFENGLMSILVGFMPSVVARKPLAARAKVADAFVKYHKAGGVRQASALAQKRYQAEVNNNVPVEDIARYEVGGSIAILVNTAPAAFWTLLLIHACPGLLDDVRKEIDACTKSSTDTRTDTTVKELDITALKKECPLLLSSYQEVLRYRSMGTSVREVMEDTYLDQWLLKKGALLQMPSRVIHQDGNIWGDDVDEFNPRRFFQRQREACFRAFGGGKTLCPGRHFATNEILAVVATFVSRFDMKPVNGSWTLPTVLNTNVAAVVMQPDHDIEVDITVRKGLEQQVKWGIKLRESEAIFALVTEDHDETA